MKAYELNEVNYTPRQIRLVRGVKGEISFNDGGMPISKENSKYILIENLTKEFPNIEKLIENLKFNWSLKNPNLLISVTGGAKNLKKIKSKYANDFKKSLINVATTTSIL